ncbi:hypothetical protein HDU98_003070, partial [Podochytrium sp. JEL0797]
MGGHVVSGTLGWNPPVSIVKLVIGTPVIVRGGVMDGVDLRKLAKWLSSSKMDWTGKMLRVMFTVDGYMRVNDLCTTVGYEGRNGNTSTFEKNCVRSGDKETRNNGWLWIYQ